jgi:rhodanese-related sulfurtransferase
MSPFILFRRLRDGQPLELIDVRQTPTAVRIEGSTPWPGSQFEPIGDRDVVFIDDDGSTALELAAELQERGFDRVKALFGGLELYTFALDPEVVGDGTFLRRIPDRTD